MCVCVLVSVCGGARLCLLAQWKVRGDRLISPRNQRTWTDKPTRGPNSFCARVCVCLSVCVCFCVEKSTSLRLFQPISIPNESFNSRVSLESERKHPQLNRAPHGYTPLATLAFLSFPRPLPLQPRPTSSPGSTSWRLRLGPASVSGSPWQPPDLSSSRHCRTTTSNCRTFRPTPPDSSWWWPSRAAPSRWVDAVLCLLLFVPSLCVCFLLRHPQSIAATTLFFLMSPHVVL